MGLLAVLTHVAGILASRWLFFAEAEHVVGLYYGKR
jgi:sulfite dehydrogenase (quinone) subunit SoeC